MLDDKCTFSELYYPSSDGKTNIHACVWQPATEVRAVVQIVHGMAEYAQRYAPFAEFLAEQGIAVCAEDHLGHGKSVCSPEKMGYFADERGSQPVLKDIRTLAEDMRGRYGGVPYIMFGHSMGSFFVRRYIALYGDELAGAVIMGTGYKGAPIVALGKFLCGASTFFRGRYSRAPFIEKLAFAGYNSKFAGRTPFDWLSSKDEHVDEYIADPLCGFSFTGNGFYGLFDIIGKACANATFAATPSNLPILLISGKDDPVGDCGKGVKKVYDKYLKYGKDVTMKLYDGCRHELLGDVCAEQTKKDISDFITRIIGRHTR